MFVQINNLIKLYFHICDKYKAQLYWEVKRHCNNDKQEAIITDEKLITIYLFCVAYTDADLAQKMKDNGTILLTPIKGKKGWEYILKQSDTAFNELFNKTISKIRQPIESFFNWINEVTQIQNASKVRSKCQSASIKSNATSLG